MIEKQKLQKLGKAELLDLIQELAGELEALKTENRQLKEQAAQRIQQPPGDVEEQLEQIMQIARSVGRIGDMARQTQQDMDDYLKGERLRASCYEQAANGERTTQKLLGSVSNLQKVLEQSSG